MSAVFTYKIQLFEDGKRVDLVLAVRPEISSRSFAQHLINKGLVRLNQDIVNKSQKVKEGQKLVYELPDPQEAELEPQDIPINILFEDADIAVVDKRAGLVVHPSYGHWEGTLVNALLFHLKGLSSIGGIKRPGIVHRLDKDTSGLMIVAKNDKAHIVLSEDIKERRVTRSYSALARGKFEEKAFSIEAPIARDPVSRKKMAVQADGRYAKTNAVVIEEFEKYTLLQLSLVTGRTHQIRVHLAYIGHPIAGDKVYGRIKDVKELGLNRQFLHAYKLSFKHPVTGKQLDFESSLPEDLEEVLHKL